MAGIYPLSAGNIIISPCGDIQSEAVVSDTSANVSSRVGVCQSRCVTIVPSL